MCQYTVNHFILAASEAGVEPSDVKSVVFAGGEDTSDAYADWEGEFVLDIAGGVLLIRITADMGNPARMETRTSVTVLDTVKSAMLDIENKGVPNGHMDPVFLNTALDRFKQEKVWPVIDQIEPCETVDKALL